MTASVQTLNSEKLHNRLRSVSTFHKEYFFSLSLSFLPSYHDIFLFFFPASSFLLFFHLCVISTVTFGNLFLSAPRAFSLYLVIWLSVVYSLSSSFNFPLFRCHRRCEHKSLDTHIKYTQRLRVAAAAAAAASLLCVQQTHVLFFYLSSFIFLIQIFLFSHVLRFSVLKRTTTV